VDWSPDGKSLAITEIAADRSTLGLRYYRLPIPPRIAAPPLQIRMKIVILRSRPMARPLLSFEESLRV
jgi:hypothetical protein